MDTLTQMCKIPQSSSTIKRYVQLVGKKRLHCGSDVSAETFLTSGDHLAEFCRQVISGKGKADINAQ